MPTQTITPGIYTLGGAASDRRRAELVADIGDKMHALQEAAPLAEHFPALQNAMLETGRILRESLRD